MRSEIHRGWPDLAIDRNDFTAPPMWNLPGRILPLDPTRPAA